MRCAPKKALLQLLLKPCEYALAGLQWTIIVYALSFGVCAILIEAKRLLLAVAFQTRYASVINFPRVITLPESGWRRRVIDLLGGPLLLK